MLKRTLLVSVVLLLSTAVLSFSQNVYSEILYRSWPYLLEKFTDGTIHTLRKDFNAPVNICIADGSVHFTENGVILQATVSDITSVEINGEKFVPCGSRMCRVIAQKDDCYIVQDTEIREEGEGVDLGFGMKSQTYASSNVSLASLANLGGQFLHANMLDVEKQKEDGEPLLTSVKTIIRTPARYIPSSKKDFTDLVGKEASSSFLKANKIKWNDPQDLLKVAEFIKSL
ncbi:MAG: hypothetical protein MJZ16_03105 [Bacteroidales bacterium]|nr:hypothetical protein [Bacteroidales bacterium]